MRVTIENLDHFGRGISHIDGKVVFIENALPCEEVDIEIIEDNKKYSIGKVVNYIKKSDKRVISECPYYSDCGGCALRNMSYDDTLEYKKNKVKNILSKYAGIDVDIEVIENKNKNNYRNKIELKIKDGIVGFYKNNTHDIVSVDKCINAEDAINNFIPYIKYLHINNGDATIKCNYNNELLIIINTLDNINIDIDKLCENNKIVGIVLNGKTIYGENNYIERVDNLFFKESYNSFFQVNRYINSKLFSIIKENITSKDTVLDLCCGVGTLSIVASENAKKVYGIEIVENAIKDALINAKMNKRDNVDFILGDAFSKIDLIKDDINVIITDPPRSGLNEKATESILNRECDKVIYISCDPITLARDLNMLKSKYNVKKVYIADMFSYTYHVESIWILSLKN